jgi:hypothetical protein
VEIKRAKCRAFIRFQYYCNVITRNSYMVQVYRLFFAVAFTLTC